MRARRAIMLLLLCPALSGVACATAGSTLDQPDAAAVTSPDASTPWPQADARTVDADDAGDARAHACEADFCAVPGVVTSQWSVNAISGTAADDVWLAGSAGTLLHYDGAAFRSLDPLGVNPLVSVWADARGAAWVVPLGQAALHAVVGADASDTIETIAGPPREGLAWAIGGNADGVWMVGDQARYDDDYSMIHRLGSGTDGGQAWSSVALECSGSCAYNFRALYTFKPMSAWALGIGGGYRLESVADADGGTGTLGWRSYPVDVPMSFEGVWGVSADNTWAVGERGGIAHFGAAGLPRWELEPSIVSVDLHAIWGSASDDVWAVGDRGSVLHYDGTTWRAAAIELPTGRSDANLYAVWGSSAEDVWIGGDGVLLHRTQLTRRRP